MTRQIALSALVGTIIAVIVGWCTSSVNLYRISGENSFQVSEEYKSVFISRSEAYNLPEHFFFSKREFSPVFMLMGFVAGFSLSYLLLETLAKKRLPKS